MNVIALPGMGKRKESRKQKIKIQKKGDTATAVIPLYAMFIATHSEVWVPGASSGLPVVNSQQDSPR